MPGNAFPSRTPNWWLPGRKPSRIHAVELDPQGKLRNGLVSCILFQTRPSQRDFVVPQRTFTPAGTGTPVLVYTDGPFGGAINTAGNSWLTVSPAALTPGAWTESCLLLFTGANLTGHGYVGSDGAGDEYFYLNSPSGLVPGSLSFNGNNQAVGSFVSGNFTGWHRITCTASAATGTGTFYFDGQLVGSQPILAAVSSFNSLLGDAGGFEPFPNYAMADHFLWNYALTPVQVAQHYAQPYRTVLRPKFAELGVVGQAAGRRPSLMTTGVGP